MCGCRYVLIEVYQKIGKKMTFKDQRAISRNMLTNPFEKFERKRFWYYSKDLSVISMNHALYSQMSKKEWTRVEE